MDFRSVPNLHMNKNLERMLVLLKPDALEQGIVGEILYDINLNGLRE